MKSNKTPSNFSLKNNKVSLTIVEHNRVDAMYDIYKTQSL